MRNYSLLFFVTLISLNIFADIRLSSPQIKLDSQDQRVIEIKIQGANIKDGDIFLNQYKSIFKNKIILGLSDHTE